MKKAQKSLLKRLAGMEEGGHYHLDLSGMLLCVNTLDREAAIQLKAFIKEHYNSGRSFNDSIAILAARYATALNAALQDNCVTAAFDKREVELAFDVLWWFYFAMSLSSMPGTRPVA